MPALVPILFGAILTIAGAYALGLLLLRKLEAPPEIVLATGAAGFSAAVFFVVLAGWAKWPVFLVFGTALCAAGAFAGRANTWAIGRPVSEQIFKGRFPRFLLLVFGAYGVWYLVNALAPETLPDGLGYHLGLPYEYIRHGGFPSRMAFFDAVPQGMEMLYTLAFTFGRGSAAKLVEFAFLLATPSLILRISRRLGMSETAGLAVAVFYFCSPVAGVTGSSSYSDAAMVFFVLAAFYCLLAWRESGDMKWLIPAGMAAGFCYAIKLTGVYAAIGAVLFVVWQRRRIPRAAGLLAAGAAVAVLPWMIRDFALTGNPLAPFANGVFPNPYFHVLTERELSGALASLGSVRPWAIPWELALGDRLTGTFGPVLFLLPLGVLAWRSRAGRLCLAAAVVLALPWLSNKGARFLMPAVALASFPMAMVLPRRAAWAAMAVQAVVCWPQVLNAWQPDWTFRLHRFPLRAALRMEPEERYVAEHAYEYNIAKMIERATSPEARIFSFDGVATAYLPRDVTVGWQSAEGDRAADTVRMASVYRNEVLYRWAYSGSAEQWTGVRFRLPRSSAAEWDICEVVLENGGERVTPQSRWRLRASPNIWEAPYALDGNLATRWRTWEPVRAGMYFEIDFNGLQPFSRAALISHTPLFGVPLEIYGRTFDGKWRLLTQAAEATPLPQQDLRLQATSALRRAGFGYLMVPDGAEGNGEIGRLMEQDPLSWDLAKVARYGERVLFRVR